jgi:HD superfamily phosphohydrolase
MHYDDRVYGEAVITEPVVLDLINCSTLQRLKDIDQAGYRPLWVKPGVETGEYDHSRFAHSVGVYLLLRSYNASLEEQIAGLIHDVSHSAFSHCIDYVLDTGSQQAHTHQDNVFDEFVRKSEIPEILRSYDLNLDYILDDGNFPLKEKDLPDLCADRIDYSLRTAVIFEEIPDGNYFLNNLTAENGAWIFKDFEIAKKYAELFLKLNIDYYSGLPSAQMFRTVGDYLRHALSSGYITEADLYTTDKIVLDKIAPHIASDPRLELLFERMNKRIGFRNDPEDFDGTVFCKSRVVDPLCRHLGKVARVSEIDPNWGGVLKKESRPKEYFLKFDR